MSEKGEKVRDARTAIEGFLDLATTLLDGLEMLDAGEKPVEVVRRTLNRAKERRRQKKVLKRVTLITRKSDSDPDEK